jgi:glutamine amidotransferase
VSVVIVDYGSGNLRSAQKAFARAATEAGMTDAIVVSADPVRVARAERVVVPGVGAFADCMAGLTSTPGMMEALTEAVVTRGQPMLGVCVGMQLLATRGLEYVTTEGLGWIPGDCRRLEPDDPALKIPHTGWNALELVRPHPVLEGIPLGEAGWHAYFVHSFVVAPDAAEDIVALSEHGRPFAAVIGRDNVVGTQFHPEKSQKLGLALIANFLRWKP